MGVEIPLVALWSVIVFTTSKPDTRCAYPFGSCMKEKSTNCSAYDLLSILTQGGQAGLFVGHVQPELCEVFML
jgi:hypothetical protein